MAHKIDDATGLPQIPEGQRWRIETGEIWYEGRGGYDGHWRKVDNKLQIVLESAERTLTSYGSGALRPYRNYHYVNEVEEVIKTNIFGKPTKKKYTTTYRADIDKELLKGNNKIAAVNAASTILNRLEKEKNRTALVGIYPPKKLEV